MPKKLLITEKPSITMQFAKALKIEKNTNLKITPVIYLEQESLLHGV